MTKGRWIILTIVLVLVVALATGIGWGLYRNSGIRLLGRAELALQTGQADKALALSDEYIESHPDHWQGYYLKARSLIAKGFFEEARRPLESAASLNPSEVAITLALADTYSLEARKAVTALEADHFGLAGFGPGGVRLSPGIDENLPVLEKAILDLRQAQDILGQLNPSSKTQEIEIRRHVGMIHLRVASIQGMLAKLLDKQGDNSELAHDPHTAQAKRKQAADVRTQADQSCAQAVAGLLELVRAWLNAPAASDPAQRAAELTRIDEVAQELVQLCLSRSDHKSLEELRKIVLDSHMQNPPPVAANMLIVEDLRTAVPKSDPASRQRKLRRSCELLDNLLKTNPDDPQVLTSRAAVALYMNDLDLTVALAGKALGQGPGTRDQGQGSRGQGPEAPGPLREASVRENPLARFLLAKVKALRGDLVGAEREFFALRVEWPRWAAAQYEYACLASALGKQDLAQEAMLAATQLEPGHSEARRFMAEMLLKEGMYKAAFTDAEAAFKARRDDPQTLLVYVEACVRTNQKELAETVLSDTALLGAASPAALLAVAEGYLLLQDEASSQVAARKAASLQPTNDLERVAVARCLGLIGKSSEAEKMLLDEIARFAQEGGARPAGAGATQPAGASQGTAEPGRTGSQAMLWAELGRLYGRSRRLIQAAEAYRQAIRLEGGNPTYALALARTLLDLGDLEECDRVLEQAPVHHPEANLLRMNVKFARGENQQALQIFRQVYSTERSGLPLAVLQLAGGQVDLCIQTCLAELANAPRDFSPGGATGGVGPNGLSVGESGESYWGNVRQVLGRAYLLAGRKDRAVEQYVAALKSEPDRLHHYISLAGLLCTEIPAEQASFRMASLPEARAELIDLSLGMILSRAGRPAQAAEYLAKLISRKGVSESVRGQARMLRSACLARSGSAEQAIIELSQLAREKYWAKPAQLARIALLARGNNVDEARRSLDALQKQAAQEQDVWLLQRVASGYISLKADAQALAVCDDLERLVPHDASSYILRGYVHSQAGRKDEMVACYRQAIQRQPERLDTYLLLANLLDLHNEPARVLALLEELKSCGLAGKAMGLWGQMMALDSWGLRTQAVRRLDELASIGYGGDQVDFMLAQYYARLGQREPARRLLRSIPQQARQYLPAQQMLIDLDDNLNGKLEALQRLERERPAHSGLLLQKMRVLLQADRKLEAVQAAESHLARFRIVPQEALHLAVSILLAEGQTLRAIEFSTNLAKTTGLAYWRALTMLLMLDEQPAAVEKMLGESDKAPLVDAMVGLCLGLQTGRQDVKQRYLARLAQLDSLHELPSLYRLLVLLAGPDVDKARAEAKAITNSMGKDVVNELVGFVGSGREGELALLLRASMLLDMGFNRWAGEVAMRGLKARPTCQWAAALTLRTEPPLKTLRETINTLQPPQTELAQAMRVRQLTLERKFSDLVQVYDQLYQADKENVVLLAEQAWATDKCGKHEQALALYRQVLARRMVPSAANNAANLIALFYADDAALMAEARRWAQAAQAAAPENPVFRETSAWLAYLQGRHEQAARELRQVIRALPGSATTHYHLGLASLAVGHQELGHWHLDEAVRLAGLVPPALQDDELKFTLERARSALEKVLQGPGTGSGPVQVAPASGPASGPRPGEPRPAPASLPGAAQATPAGVGGPVAQ